MDNVIPIHRDAHREALRLLPWFVTGVLADEERTGVEAHLEGCSECRAELALERRLAAEVAAMPTEIEPAWAAMERRLAAPTARRRKLSAPARRAALPWVGWALAAQILLVLGALALFPVRAGAPAHEYHALASASSPADVAVIFRPSTTEAEMRQVLQMSQARVTGGPTAAGAWLLSVPAGDRDAAVRGLRARPEVVTAEPLDPVGP